MDIQNMLDTGYFATSQAGPQSSSSGLPPMPRSDLPDRIPPPVPVHGHIPRTVYLAPAPPPKKPFPPSPTVEDEIDSLAKEHGSSSTSILSDQEPPSKGDLNQHPVILEVHEHNPERRFVIVPESVKDQPSSTDSPPPQETWLGLDEARSPGPSKETQRLAAGFDSEAADFSRYGLQRRKSQQGLSPLQTDSESPRGPPHHHRTQSATVGPRVDYFNSRQPRSYGDVMLSPDVISKDNERERSGEKYRGLYSGTHRARSPSRGSYPLESQSSRSVEYDHQETSRAPSSARRPNTDSNSRNRPVRRISSHTSHRYRDDIVYSSGNEWDHSQAYNSPTGPKVPLSPRSSRDPSLSSDGFSRSPQGSAHLPSKPVVVQDTKPYPRQGKMNNRAGHPRSTSRAGTLPTTMTESPPSTLASVQTSHESPNTTSKDDERILIPNSNDRPTRGSKTQLPYPDDDQPFGAGLGIQDSHRDATRPKGADVATVTMPEPLPASTGALGHIFETQNGTPSTEIAAAVRQTWTPGSFDPVKDGLPSERPMGAYRRYSENHGKDGADFLPECPRRKPVAGMVDWLTLPHTSFNICPSCYDAVFAQSEYRTLFKPMLRPSDELFACDFGVSPWYRIAWLLTLKERVPDLRLLQQIAGLDAASNREACSGPKKALKDWFTVKDPQMRLPVTDFTVCYQCAKTVELLLPNLAGVFEPLGPRPRQDVCDLHFSPDRKEFVSFFDVLETTSEEALKAKKQPDLDDLARQLWNLTAGHRCREDAPVLDGYWHTMKFLQEFTVCGECFEDVVKPKLADGNVIARNFYMKSARLPSATCQLYSARMRDIFRRSCRANDPKYLEEKVLQRLQKEKSIYEQLVKLDKAHMSSFRKEEEVGQLIEEWKRWE